MYKLTLDEEAKEAHLNCYFDAISGALKTLADGDSVSFGRAVSFTLAGSNADVRELFQILYKYNCKREESILVSTPEVLNRLITEIDAHVEQCKWAADTSPYKECLKFIKKLFSYERFSFAKRGLVYNSEEKIIRTKEIRHIANARWHDIEWSPLVFIESLDLRYCPYCNAETIYSIDFDRVENASGDVRTARSALDHYFPKAQYPYLAISLCNLVPSCTRCNTNIKGKRELLYGRHLNPYEMSFHAAVTFNVKPLLVGVGFYPSRIENEAGFVLELQPAKNADMKISDMGMALAEFFRLETIYNNLFKFEALQSIHRSRIVSRGYYEYLSSVLKEKISWPRFKELMLSVPKEPTDITKIRLSKLALDMYKFEKAHKERLIPRQ